MPALPARPLTGPLLQRVAAAAAVPGLRGGLARVSATLLDLGVLREASIPREVVPWSPQRAADAIAVEDAR